MRIGLTQRVEHIASYGERRDCLDQAWTALLEGMDMIPVPLPSCLRAPARHVEALALDGVILTGGNDLCGLPGASNTAPERDALEAALLELARTRGLPVLGVCRGLQHIVAHHGGALRRVEGHVRARHPITREPGVRPELPLTDRDEVNSFHGYGVTPEDLASARGLLALARAPDGTVEAVVHERLPIAGIMWHPERAPNDPRDRALISAFFRGSSPASSSPASSPASSSPPS